MDTQQTTPTPVQNPSSSNLLTNIKSPYILVIVGALMILILATVYVLSGKTVKKESIQMQNKEKQTAVINKALSGSIKLETALNLVKKSQPLILTLVVDSDNQAVTGYDVLISYNTEAFDFVKATSKIKDFSLYTFKKTGHVTVTAVKALQSRVDTVMTATQAIELTFQPKKTGSYTFSISKTIGTENTSLVTSGSKKLSPEVNALSVTVGE